MQQANWFVIAHSFTAVQIIDIYCSQSSLAFTSVLAPHLIGFTHHYFDGKIPIETAQKFNQFLWL